MNKGVKILLIATAVACFGVALYYPLHYEREQSSNASNMEELAALRLAGMASEDRAETTEGNGEAGPSAELTRTAPVETEAPGAAEVPEAQEEAPAGEVPADETQGEVPADETQGEVPSDEAQGEAPADVTQGEAPSDETQGEVPSDEAQGEASGQSQTTDNTTTVSGGEGAAAADATVEATGGAAEIAATSPNPVVALPRGETSGAEGGEASARPEATPEATGTEPEDTPSPEPTPTPSPTPNRRERSGVLPYSAKEKVEFDESRILGRYKAIYQLNKDFIGWITIPGTDVDYPVVQTAEDGDYYLHHDFFGAENNNGQIILDPLCDPYTPSYNLVISGHNMRSGSMFGNLDNYTSKSYWSKHKYIQFDTLMDERHYVVLAAFYSADYDIDEKGFRYNADIQYRMDAEQWLREVANNRLYDTGIEADFGDEFLTLTTCNYARRKDGRFVLVCRRIREGETFE